MHVTDTPWAALDLDQVSLEVLLPPAYYLVNRPGYRLGPLLLDAHVISWVLDGSMTVAAGDSLHEVPSGSVCLVPGGVAHSYEWKGRTRHASTQVRVSGEVVLPGIGNGPLVRRMPPGDVVRPLFAQACQLFRLQPPGWDRLAVAALRHLLVSFLAGTPGAGGDPRAGVSLPTLPEPVEAALQYVAIGWYRQPWRAVSPDELARAAGVSYRQLSRLFVSTIGLSPARVLTLARLQGAANLLATSGSRVSEIAVLTGFSDQFHLSRAFKAVYGVSPRRYRDSLLDGAPVPPSPLPEEILQWLYS